MSVSLKEKTEALTEQIKLTLLYVGIISSIISAIAYVIITFVLVVGFTSDIELQAQITISVLGAVTGLLITFSLRNQGIMFAKREDESQNIMREYNQLLNKDKKEKELHDIRYHLIRATIKDVIFKGITVAVSLFFVLYIAIEGNGNYSLLALAFANIFMFTGFGLVGLSNMYDKYMDEHLPVMKERIERMKNVK